MIHLIKYFIIIFILHHNLLHCIDIIFVLFNMQFLIIIGLILHMDHIYFLFIVLFFIDLQSMVIIFLFFLLIIYSMNLDQFVHLINVYILQNILTCNINILLLFFQIIRKNILLRYNTYSFLQILIFLCSI